MVENGLKNCATSASIYAKIALMIQMQRQANSESLPSLKVYFHRRDKIRGGK